jgi:hypothetical protein
MTAIGLTDAELEAVVEADEPRIAAIASIGSRRPIIVRRSVLKCRSVYARGYSAVIHYRGKLFKVWQSPVTMRVQCQVFAVVYGLRP